MKLFPWNCSTSASVSTSGVIKSLLYLKQTPNERRLNWAKWPTDDAFDDAVHFVESWNDRAIRTPDIGVADDGEVNFLWKRESSHVDLGFYGDGVFSYYARNRKGREFTGDEVPVDDGLTEDLIGIIGD